ncbi:MAG: gamma carbonic anhydrase family protein [Gammaproteobacteria bacterium]|nr:MAG: gamma carbonic anhydrase family protein [Gammaproteobacteria bacterium]
MKLRAFEGRSPQLGERVFVDEAAVIIGDVVLGDDCSVWPGTVIRGDIHYIRIGARTNVQDNSTLHVTHASEYTAPDGYPLHIGDEVTIGHGAIVHACTIGNRCLIGMGSIVLDGAVLEDEVLLGAGSLVAPGKQLEGGYLWLGRPARRARPLTEREREYLRYSAEHYVRLKDRFLS